VFFSTVFYNGTIMNSDGTMERVERTGGLISRSFHWLAFLAVGLVFLGWLLNTPEGLLGKADAIGYAVCHRIELRSFHLGERQLPLCARCTGMFIGAVVGLVYQFALFPKRSGTPRRGILVTMGMMILAFAIDGINSYVSLFPGAPTLYAPNNTLRLLTGTGMGLVIAAVLFIAFNQTIWKDFRSDPAFENWRSYAGLIGLGLIFDGVILTENPLVLYPLALISAAGVLVLLTMIYAMLLLIVTRAENRFTRVAEIALPLAAGFSLGILQVGVLDLIRFWLTGTWDGFHLG
jgi:uncharacterized membrane protein